MKWWDKVLEKCIERKPQTEAVKRRYTREELMRIIEEAERKQLEEIFRRNGYKDPAGGRKA